MKEITFQLPHDGEELEFYTQIWVDKRLTMRTKKVLTIEQLTWAFSQILQERAPTANEIKRMRCKEHG